MYCCPAVLIPGDGDHSGHSKGALIPTVVLMSPNKAIAFGSTELDSSFVNTSTVRSLGC